MATPITARAHVNDAGIRTFWLVGTWPDRAMFSHELFNEQNADMLQLRDGDVEVDFVNASARYRVTSSDRYTGIFHAALIEGEIRMPEPDDHATRC